MKNNIIEKEIFKKAKIDLNKFLEYGFKLENNKYCYSKNILDNFRVEIICDDYNLIGKIYDLKMNDEYTNFRNANCGKFANKIKEEYIKVLEDIRVKCCDISYFESNQANRICDYIINKYDDYPEFMWDKYPGYGVFRNKVNNKWYAVILNINKNKFCMEDKEVEIINLKVNPSNIENFLKRNGYFEGYHMNKKNWISIILDDNIKDSEIIQLVNDAYMLINKK